MNTALDGYECFHTNHFILKERVPSTHMPASKIDLKTNWKWWQREKTLLQLVTEALLCSTAASLRSQGQWELALYLLQQMDVLCWGNLPSCWICWGQELQPCHSVPCTFEQRSLNPLLSSWLKSDPASRSAKCNDKTTCINLFMYAHNMQFRNSVEKRTNLMFQPFRIILMK